ncbi:hypothetical protein HFN60_30335 [Rhizobium leguminosarum]|uniref:hypothetical protein n=1 Tax=Rhizobium leguminosarum TaxID=384 RepID=UPI001C976D76|nr:hypothetical protein [Rhizobium leguminosarum]MBY5819892.1 hypothetical protein [Rhizobium leguminosarum]
MSLFRNSIVHFGSWAAFGVSIIWAVVDPGFEPVVGLFLGAAGIAANFDDFPLFKKPRKLSPEERIALRDKWRPTFKDYFLKLARDKRRTDVIVRDVARLDVYPEVDEKETGISSWFRVGFLGSYDSGVLLGLRWTYLVQHGDVWREDDHEQPGSIKVMVVAEVPFEAIESFNADGDDYYRQPHIFCHFEYEGSPYRRRYYGEERQVFPDSPYFYAALAEVPKPTWIDRLKWRWTKRK